MVFLRAFVCLVIKESFGAKCLKVPMQTVPSTAAHSNRTCPDVRARGSAKIPLHAGHQSWRAYPGLGALLPSGTWSIIHRFSTLRKEIKKESYKIVDSEPWAN